MANPIEYIGGLPFEVNASGRYLINNVPYESVRDGMVLYSSELVAAAAFPGQIAFFQTPVGQTTAGGLACTRQNTNMTQVAKLAPGHRCMVRAMALELRSDVGSRTAANQNALYTNCTFNFQLFDKMLWKEQLLQHLPSASGVWSDHTSTAGTEVNIMNCLPTADNVFWLSNVIDLDEKVTFKVVINNWAAWNWAGAATMFIMKLFGVEARILA